MKICMISFGPIKSKSNGYFIRIWNILKELSKSNEIIVLEFPEVVTKDKIEKFENITFIRLRGNETSSNQISNIIKKFLTFDPFHNLKFQVFSFFEFWKHKEYISSADAVIVEGCLIPAGNIIAKLLRKKVILDTHCINKLLAKGYKRRNLLVYFLRTILWDFLERFTIKLSDIVITVSEKEKRFVIKEYKVQESRVFVVPNIIEPPEKISKKIIEDLRKKLGLENKIVVMFVGNLESVQNADAVEYIINELAPWLWERRKDVVFLIIGKGNERFNCGLSNVIFTGFVEDLAPYLAMSDVCIAPLRVGAGTKTKILEYLAYRKPVITTPIGVEGIREASNVDSIIIVQEHNEFPKKLLTMINTLKELKNKALDSIRIIEENYSKKTLRKKLMKLLEEYNSERWNYENTYYWYGRS